VNATDQIIFTMNVAQQIYLWESLNNKPVFCGCLFVKLMSVHFHQHTTKYNK